MKFIIPIFILILFNADASAQSTPLKYARVKIYLEDTDITTIARLGLEADHGQYVSGKFLINDYSTREVKILVENNIPHEIIIPDVKAHYIEQNKSGHEHNRDIDFRGDICDIDINSLYNYNTPDNYRYGSMGGYLTYDELLSTLDTMVQLFPDLISAREPIGDIVTHENRPIYWLRLSDNPNIKEEEEPELLYTALHHAREPNGLSQMIFYIWYLLENYESDPEIKYLVDNTEMYFIPCVNPDGYVYNQSIDPQGGGLWRKNRRAQDEVVHGVDLNRNYGFKWGFDNTGSSNNMSSNTYRGTEGFSEPETQAVRDFCIEHNFKIALNYHTYGNLLIYPWGYNDQLSPDSATFTAFGDVMTQENNFTKGTGTQTVGYIVNGDSDDWFYGDTISKPAIFAMTPEVGPNSYGFWPPQSEIDRLNKSVLRQNLIAAHLLLNYGEAEELTPVDVVMERDNSMDVLIKKYGLADGEITVSLKSIGNNFEVMTSDITQSMQHLDESIVSFDYTVFSDTSFGDEFLFALESSNGIITQTDTIRKIFVQGDLNPLFTDDISELDNWVVSDLWGISEVFFVSEPSSITDSPEGDYLPNANHTITLTDPISLIDADAAELSFNARWITEANYDYVQVLASSDGVAFTPLCGKYSRLGNENQAFNEPLYDGNQQEWIVEQIDLSDYLDGEIWIRFSFVSDGGVEADGFYFDDIYIHTFNEFVVSSTMDFGDGVRSFKAYPNPVIDQLKINVELKEAIDLIELKLINSLGQVMDTKVETKKSDLLFTHLFNMDQLAGGVYFVQLYLNGRRAGGQKIIK